MARGDNIDITFWGRDLSVDFHYYPPSRGERDSYGVPLEPDEDGVVELEAIWMKGRDIINMLSADTLGRIEADIMESGRE